MQRAPVETIGQLKDQLRHCRLELEKAVQQLVEVEEQLHSVGDAGVDQIRSMRGSVEDALAQLEPALEELATVDDRSLLSEHQEKLARMALIFQALEGLQGKG